MKHFFVIFTIFRQNGVIFLIIWWLYDGRHILYMAVGVHIVRRPSTARTATVVQRGLAWKGEVFTAEYMMYLGVWAGGVGNVGLCSTIACQIDVRVGA